MILGVGNRMSQSSKKEKSWRCEEVELACMVWLGSSDKAGREENYRVWQLFRCGKLGRRYHVQPRYKLDITRLSLKAMLN